MLQHLFEHHVLDLHDAGGGAALVFLQLHGDELDGLLVLGDHHVLQGVDPAAGAFYLRRQTEGESKHLALDVIPEPVVVLYSPDAALLRHAEVQDVHNHE